MLFSTVQEYINTAQQFVTEATDAEVRREVEILIRRLTECLPMNNLSWADRLYDAYLDRQIRRQREEMDQRIRRQREENLLDHAIEQSRHEAEQYRDVLLRKYRQLVYIDEYDTLELGQFKAEVARFVAKRLPDEPPEVAAGVVLNLVLAWIEEAGAQNGDGFDPAMSPSDYERLCAERFAAAGWKARCSGRPGDQGANVICEANGRRLVVQCKLYSSPVGNAAVQEVIAAQTFEDADLAAVVSNSSYTPGARKLASAASVLLLHHDDIPRLNPPTIDASATEITDT